MKRLFVYDSNRASWKWEYDGTHFAVTIAPEDPHDWLCVHKTIIIALKSKFRLEHNVANIVWKNRWRESHLREAYQQGRMDGLREALIAKEMHAGRKGVS